eukprot:SM000240S08619  [mRNA]  locus=s240:108359:112142:- [translate_table: standard]
MTQHCCGGTFWLYILIIVGLVAFGGLMAGLTLGLMSLGLVDLEVLQKSGSDKDKRNAARILPVVRKQHLLLCTLLIGNACANEALPIFLDALVPSWASVLISHSLSSVKLIAASLFPQIVPQAVCSKYGLVIGATLAPLVRVLMVIAWPVAFPISKLLDYLLGHNKEALFRRAELKAFVDMHGQMAGKGGELSHDETMIIAGALELTEKTAVQAMTPISSTFALDIDAKLDWNLIRELKDRGHSRVPVYSGSPTNLIGLVLVKNLLDIRPEEEVLVRNVTIRKLPRVSDDMPLYDILNEFQKGHSHMAAVVHYHSQSKRVGSNRTRTGQLSMRRNGSRDFVKVVDVKQDTPLVETNQINSNIGGHSPLPKPSLPAVVHADQLNTVEVIKEAAETGLRNKDGQGVAVTRRDSGPPLQNSPVGNAAAFLPKLPEADYQQTLQQSQPSLGRQTGGLSLRERKQRSNVASILDIGPNITAIPSFSEDEEVVGIITMEDLIEELLQEEILDETDKYVDVHNKIQVNRGVSTSHV